MTAPGFVLREARIADAAELALLARELGYAATAAAIRQRLEGVQGRPNELVIVAEHEGQIAGWMQAHASIVVESGFRAEVLGLIVGKRFRRRGFGRALIEHAEQWARRIGAEAIVIRTNTQRIESHHFYPALGYALSKTQSVFRKNFGK